MRALFGPDRDLTWGLAVAIISLGLSVVIGRHQGHLADFASGLFLGLSLSLSVLYLVLMPRRRHAGE